MINLISLGAGVQSSTMALMAAHGEITPMPDAAVFADTQDETGKVYRWLEWLRRRLPFPVYDTTKGKLSEAALRIHVSKKGVRYSKTDIPFFTLDPKTAKIGKIKGRACTRDYKLLPLIAVAREQIGRKAMLAWRKSHQDELAEIAAIAEQYKGKKSKFARIAMSAAFKSCQVDAIVTQWVGISTDEITRAKPSREPWIVVRHPLLELRKTRLACHDWMRDHGYPDPPRSACRYCPFRSNSSWRQMKAEEPDEFALAVAFEQAVQAVKADTENMNCVPYLHRSCKPLDQVDFRSDEDFGQATAWQDECEGMCGV